MMTHLIVSETPYYLTSPQQSRPPEGMFKVGTKVKILEEQPAYCRIESENGITAWVATSDLKRL